MYIKLRKFHYLPQLGIGDSGMAYFGDRAFPCHGKRNELNAKWCYSYTYDTQKITHKSSVWRNTVGRYSLQYLSTCYLIVRKV